MRFAASALLLCVGACQSEAKQPRPPDAVLTPSPSPSPSPSPPPAAEPPAPKVEVACLEDWPGDLRKPPSVVIPEAVAVCIDGKRFEGAELDDLRKALGLSLSEGQKPKCAMGYPSLTFVTKDGNHSELVFCGNYGTREGYFYFEGSKLAVAKPEAVERWLREKGLLSK